MVRSLFAIGLVVALTFSSLAGPRRPPVPSPPWPTYHQDNFRAGSYPEPPLDAASPEWSTSALDGAIYAEPVWQGNVVYVGTENDTVYAIDRLTGRIRWSRHLAAPAALASLPCGDINPLGITGTPVIARHRLYVAAETASGAHMLYALSLATGRVTARWPVDPRGSSPSAQQQRAALSYRDGTVYVPLGGLYGDCGPYHGYVIAVSVARHAPDRIFEVPSAREGAIWAPSGLSIGRYGRIYLATGNGSSVRSYDGGDSIIALRPSLHEVQYWAPPNWAYLNAADLDLGSTGPMLLPHHRLFQIGKAGVGYLLSSLALPGVSAPIYQAAVCSGAYGGDAFAAGRIFIPCADGLFAVGVPSANTLRLLWGVRGFLAGPPVVGGGVVFTVNISQSRLVLISETSGKVLETLALPGSVHFDAPSLAPSQVLVPAGSRLVAFRLVP